MQGVRRPSLLTAVQTQYVAIRSAVWAVNSEILFPLAASMPRCPTRPTSIPPLRLLALSEIIGRKQIVGKAGQVQLSCPIDIDLDRAPVEPFQPPNP